MIAEVMPRRIIKELQSRCSLSEVYEVRLRESEIVATGCFGRMSFCGARREEIEYVIERATDCSVYAFDEEMKRGYITYKNLRIGIAGELTCGEFPFAQVYSLVVRRLSSDIRLDERVADAVIFEENVRSALVVSPPSCGKTTLLRALSREIARVKNLVVIDTRREIATYGEKNFEVLSGIDKKRGFELAIRCLSAEVIMCDELYFDEDLAECEMAMASGVAVVASMHGSERDIRIARARKLFDVTVTLSARLGKGTVESVDVK